MLSAALDEALLGDPNTSVDDIVGILSIALNMPTGKQGSGSIGGSLQEQQQVQGATARQRSTAAASTAGLQPAAAAGTAAAPAAAAAGMPSPEEFLASAEKLLGLPPGLVQSSSPAPAAAEVADTRSCAVLGSKEQSSSGQKETASEMAARLLAQARLMHAKAAAHVGGSSQATAAAAAAGQAASAGGGVQQAARDSMRAWQAEGGLMYKSSSGGSSFKAAMAGLGYNTSTGGGSPSGAAAAPLLPGVSGGGYLGNLQAQAQAQSRVSPLSGRGRGSGSYAGRASARRSMSPPCQQQDGASTSQQQSEEPRMIPAEVEKAWRQALRSPKREGAQGGVPATGNTSNKAGGSEGPYAAILEGFDGSGGPQEWAGYDGLMGLRQQQRKGGKGAGSSGGGAKLDPEDVNSYRAKQTPELDAKLQRLYQRNVDWRQRCEVVYARQRYAEVASELQECTFQPEINKKSQQLVQVRDVCRMWAGCLQCKAHDACRMVARCLQDACSMSSAECTWHSVRGF
jgi:hypothetical protein